MLKLGDLNWKTGIMVGAQNPQTFPGVTVDHAQEIKERS